MRNRTVVTAFIMVLAFAVLAEAQSTRNTGERRNKRQEPLEIKPRTVVVVPYLTGGLLFGEAVEGLEDIWQKGVYGFGVNADYRTSPHYRLGIQAELLWNQATEDEDVTVRMWSWGVSGMYFFRPDNESSVYLRGEAGLGWITGWRGDDHGVHTVLRIGLGLQVFTASTVSTRTEIYSRIILTQGYDEPAPWKDNTNLTYVGLKMAMAFGL